MSFGTLCKQKLYVTVDTNDETISSSVSEITLKYNGAVLQTKQTTTGKAIFELTKDKFKTGAALSATAKDVAGNESVLTKPTDVGAQSDTVKIDETKPTATIKTDTAVYTDASNNKWYKENVGFTVTAKDENMGIKSVKIKLNGQELVTDINGKAIDADFSNSFTGNEEFKISTSQHAVDGKNILEVTTINNAGVESDKETETVYIDNKNPNVSSFKISKVNDNPFAKLINRLTFGTFFNEKVKITVKATDETAASGVKSITLYADDNEIETLVVDNQNECTFVVTKEEIVGEDNHFSAKLSAKATDNVGRVTTTAVEPNTQNSDVKSSGLMLETIKPIIDKPILSVETYKNVNQNTFNKNQEWFGKDTNVNFTVTVSDADSGLKSVAIKLNGTSLITDVNGKNIAKDYDAEDAKTTTDTFVVSTSQVARDESKGSFTLEVEVCDNAGNVAILDPKTVVYKDTEAPIITEFDFEPEDYVEGAEKNEDGNWVESTTYGFYFKADTKVTVRAKDTTPSSGVNDIFVYLYDVTTKKYIAIKGNVDKKADLDDTYSSASDAVDYANYNIFEINAALFAFDQNLLG